MSSPVDDLIRRGRLADAAALLSRMVAADRGNGRLRKVLVNVLASLGDASAGNDRLPEALDYYRQGLEVEPRHFGLLMNRGVVLYRLQRLDDAIDSYRAAIAVDGLSALARSALGTALSEAELASEAIEHLQRAVELEPANPDFLNNLGLALDRAGRLDEAVEAFDSALRVDPTHQPAWLNRGVALQRLRRVGEAIDSFDRALALDPADPDAWSNKGLVFAELQDFDRALDAHDAALALDDRSARYWANKGSTLSAAKRYPEAEESLLKSVSLDPSTEVRGDLLHAQMQMCQWSSMDEHVRLIQRDLEEGRGIVQPFTLLPTPASSEIERLASRRFAASLVASDARPLVANRFDNRRIKVGYASADFRRHPMMDLMLEVFEAHDQSMFETIALSIGPGSDDPERARARSAFSEFVDLSHFSDDQVGSWCRERMLDIVVDLGGYTRFARPGIFARRVAPAQVNYLGYPGTLGSPLMDYILADRIVIPESDRALYDEEVVYLPACYMGNGRWVDVPAPRASRVDAGLPKDGFVFCCFNNNYKITPDVFDVWMRILRTVNESVLWLLETHPAAKLSLQREAAARGVNPDRLVFAARADRESHLERHHLADVFLDTFHYGAHTTASDALRACLPIVTMAGPTFQSRVAASLLTTLGLHDLVCSSVTEYEALASRLAADSLLLTGARARIAATAPKSTLFSPVTFARSLEDLYRGFALRQAAGTSV